ncbi:MAG: type II secretion system protein [Nitrospirae bacterium]|nr:type II secretion system protein [Nitrospirota bacterium]
MLIFNSRLFRTGGFTLLEVLIALAVVGGLLVTLIYTLNYQLSILERHEKITISTLLAKNKMLEIEKNPADTSGNFEDPFSSYSYETKVKESPYAGISEVIVSVKAGDEEVKLNEFISQLQP